jgi:hypothetical protein
MSLPGFTAEYSFYKRTRFYDSGITNSATTYNTVILQMDPGNPNPPRPGSSTYKSCDECYLDGLGNFVMHCCERDTLTGTALVCGDYPCSFFKPRAFPFDFRRFGGDPAPLVSRFRGLSSLAVRR